MITYPWWDQSYMILVKGATENTTASQQNNPGPVSISDKTSHHKISWRLEAACPIAL